jgi:phosphoserine phosphatase
MCLPGKLIALRNKTDDLVTSMELDAPYSIGEGKVDCIRTFIAAGNRHLFGIGDSMHDLPMIEYADIPAVVDRGNAMTQQARQRGWFILPCRAASCTFAPPRADCLLSGATIDGGSVRRLG